ncbi:MAG: hypothetical protein NT062_35390 [Proteobacteria bacterium]|nr:hypothetical protein [Pseudomonadota bacterium]
MHRVALVSGLLASLLSSLSACDHADDSVGATPDASACVGLPVAGPSPRGEVAGVIDATRDRFVVFGGNVAAPVNCMPMTDIVDEVWAFDLACGAWQRLTPTGGPGPRARHAVALDATHDRMLVFGGRTHPGSTYTNYADVWSYDLATDAWTAVSTTGTGPSPRSSATAVYDATHDRLLVFGGNTSTSGLVLTGTNDLWSLDLATGAWTAITAPNPPSPRLFHAAAIVGGDMVVYGGTPSFDGPFLDDAFALDLASTTWRPIAGSGPGARFGSVLVASGTTAVAIGGHDGTALGNRNDAWSLAPSTGAWQQLRPGDTLHGTGAACSFPPDFTIPEANSPERRYAFAAASTATDLWIFGGKTDCGVVNDVWRLDGSTATWQLVRPATGGEACNRTGNTACTTLCY